MANLMLTATCDNTDAFSADYLKTKAEFAQWCDSSRCVLANVGGNNLIELFFDVDMAKLKVWIGQPSTQALFRAHHFVPTRYTFTPIQMPAPSA